ncbi:MAG: Cdc6/Cdc18 family protein [Candidatus Methanospirareceae archaeon]
MFNLVAERMRADAEEGGAIFRAKEVLRPPYIPERIPHREEHIERLTSVLADAIRAGSPVNIVLFGPLGTGKTVTVKHVSRALERRANTVYINSEIFDTPYRVVAYLARKFNKRVPMIGWPAELLYAELKSAIDAEKQHVIVIVDEFEMLVRNGDETFAYLMRLNSELKHAQVSFVCLADELSFSKFQNSKARSAASWKGLRFLPYTTEELKDILYDRAQRAFVADALEESVIPLCAALANSGLGDAGYALELLLVSGEIAEQSGVKPVCADHVRYASEHITQIREAERITMLPVQQKLVLSAVLFLVRERRRGRFSSGEVYTRYCELCAQMDLNALTQRRFSDFIAELAELELLTAEVVSRGRYGRSKVISLRIPAEFLQPVLFGDAQLKALSSVVEGTSVAV